MLTINEMYKEYMQRYYALTNGYKSLEPLMQAKYENDYRKRIQKLFILIDLCNRLRRTGDYE